jgi:hypothetical protein
MKSYGVNSYRLSLSWSRIIPGGRSGQPVNVAGVQWYRRVLKRLLEVGIVSRLNLLLVFDTQLMHVAMVMMIDPIRCKSGPAFQAASSLNRGTRF